MNYSAGIKSLAIALGSIVRTNDYWQENFPQLFEPKKLRQARSFKATKDNSQLSLWSQAVTPYLVDPFRGNVERRVCSPTESSLDLEYRAAKEALDAPQLDASEVDLMMVATLFPEQIISGNAVNLAQKLNLQCPAWNLESTCSSALIALENARALIETQRYSRILVVTSHVGSNSVREDDTLSWSMGDAAGAFVVEANDRGILGSKIVNTVATYNAYGREILTNEQGEYKISTFTGDNISAIAETAEDYIRICCLDAIADAGLSIKEIDFFIFNTPTAWYANLCVTALNIDPDRTVNLYPRYANIGSVYPLAGLYHAANEGQINADDLVLIYTNGAGATAGAMVVRWGEVTLGLAPAPSLNVSPEQEKAQNLQIANLQLSSIAVSSNSLSLKQLLALEPKQQRQLLENYLLQLLSELLKVPQEYLDLKQHFPDLIDSLMAIEIKRRIEDNLQLQIPIEEFFGIRNLDKIVDLLSDKLLIIKLASFSSAGDKDTKTGKEIEEILL